MRAKSSGVHLQRGFGPATPLPAYRDSRRLEEPGSAAAQPPPLWVVVAILSGGVPAASKAPFLGPIPLPKKSRLTHKTLTLYSRPGPQEVVTIASTTTSCDSMQKELLSRRRDPSPVIRGLPTG